VGNSAAETSPSKTLAPESRTFTLPAADLDVGGFEIAMDDAALMRRFEHVGHLRRNPQRFVDRQRASAVWIAGDSVGQDLEREVAVQASVMCAVDLAHATGANRTGDFVGADTVTGDQCQLSRGTFCRECPPVDALMPQVVGPG